MGDQSLQLLVSKLLQWTTRQLRNPVLLYHRFYLPICLQQSSRIEIQIREEHKYIREGETISDNNELQLSFTLGVTNVLQNKDNNNDKKKKKKGILHTYQNDWGQFKRAWLAGSFNESDDLSRLQKQ